MTRTIVRGDPTPQLTKQIEEDMRASALDAFHRYGNCSGDLLQFTYGFTCHQVDCFAAEAIHHARHTWLEQKVAGDAA